MTRSTDKLLDRVRKLLALAESANVHEAAAAAGRAQALITRYQLEGLLEARDAAEAELSDGRDQPLVEARKIRKWKRVLASTLAAANGCQAYTVQAAKREQHLCIAGHPDDRAAVSALWDWLVKRLEWLSATHGAGQDRDWHESFRIGAVDTIAQRLETARREARQALVDGGEEGPRGGAMVRVEAALEARAEAVDRFVDDHLDLKKGRSITVRIDALEAGRAAGRDVALPDEG